jgi:biopolymer transport protein ExbD
MGRYAQRVPPKFPSNNSSKRAIMLNRSQADDEEVAIDLSPMIDCVFILLIFFIVTTVFVEDSGVEVTKPQADRSSDLKKTVS